MSTSVSVPRLLWLLVIFSLVGLLLLPARTTPVSGVACLDAEAEPNGRVQEARALPPLCEDALVTGALPEGDNEDLYRLDLDQAGLIRLQLSTLPAGADYDLYLYNAARELIAASRQVGGSTEQIELRLAKGTYYLRVYPFAGHSTQAYNLSWSRVTPP